MYIHLTSFEANLHKSFFFADAAAAAALTLSFCRKYLNFSLSREGNKNRVELYKTSSVGQRDGRERERKWKIQQWSIHWPLFQVWRRFYNFFVMKFLSNFFLFSQEFHKVGFCEWKWPSIAFLNNCSKWCRRILKKNCELDNEFEERKRIEERLWNQPREEICIWKEMSKIITNRSCETFFKNKILKAPLPTQTNPLFI